MKNFKKMLSAMLVMALTLSLCACGGSPTGDAPSAAPDTANETLITLEGSSATVKGGGASASGSTVNIKAAGTYRISGSLDDGCVIVDTGEVATEVTLILDGADIACTTGPAIHVKQAKDLRVVLADGSVNTLTSGTEGSPVSEDASGAALYSEDDMDIEGNGALSVLGYINNGIGSKKDLDINGGNISVSAMNNGIRGANSVEIKGGTVSVTAANDGVKATATDKPGKGYVTVSGGALSVYAKGDGVSAATELNITGGTLAVEAVGDGQLKSSKALKAVTDLNISGGSVSLFSLSSTAAACDGNITVSGGEVTICAAKRGFNATGSYTLTGGEVLAIIGSGKNAEPVPGGQSYICAALSGKAGDSVTVSGAAQLASLEARTDYSQVFFSAPDLTAGTEYTAANQNRSVSAVA